MGNWERLVWNQRDALIAGFAVTVEVCVIAFLAAIVGGLVLCLVRLYVAPLRPIAIVLIEFFATRRYSCS
jgi:polar amino acid transport system permease protein